MAAEPQTTPPSNPITKRNVSRLRAVAVICADSTGETRFDGTPLEISRAAGEFVPRGGAAWFYETRTGGRYPWPQDPPPRQQPAGEDSRQESAFYLAERMMEINAKVYRDAYSQVGNLMGNVLDSYATALVSLSNRLADTEATIADLQTIMTTRAVQGEKDQNDELAGKLIETMMEHASAGNAKAAPAQGRGGAAKPSK